MSERRAILRRIRKALRRIGAGYTAPGKGTSITLRGEPTGRLRIADEEPEQHRLERLKGALKEVSDE